MDVPFVDLPRQYLELKDEIDEAVGRVMRRCNFVLGEEVERFEASFAELAGAKHAVGVGSGTDALHLILRALGIGPGDEVITVANTFIATVEAISYAGARPVLVDCDETTHQIDAEAVARALTPRTKAIVPVHLYGQPANVDVLATIAREAGAALVEDAAQAHGALLRGGRACGSLGRAAGFSFYPGKNLGAYGDGGAITTSDDELAERVRKLRNWGGTVKYHHEVKGFNSRLDTIQAAVLGVKLPRLPAWNEARARAARWYRAALADVDGLGLPVEAPWTERHAYHLFVVRVPAGARERIMGELRERGIATGIHYPRPVHLQPAYADLGLVRGTFPNAERASAEVLSLPMFPEITREEVDHVAAALRDALAGR